MPRNNEDFGTGNKLDPRVFMEGRHIGFQDQHHRPLGHPSISIFSVSCLGIYADSHCV